MVTRREVQLTLLDNLVWIIVLGFILFFSFILGGKFFSFTNLHYMLYSSAVIAPLILAEGICLLSGNFDLSVAQIAGLSAMITAVLIVSGVPGYIAIFLVVLIGAGLGVVNGLFIGKIGMNPFLITLSTYIMYDWMTHVVRRTSVVGLPGAYLFPGSGQIGGIYITILIFAAVAVLAFLVLRKTTFGRHIYSVGGNPEASKMLGIDTGNVLFFVFVISGALSGLAGLFYTGFAGAATSTLADGKTFMAFAGAIIGGISLDGGRGRISGAVGGVILIGVIKVGLTMLKISPPWQGFFTGLLILAAILINRFKENIRARILRHG